MSKLTICAALALSAPALGAYSIELAAPGGGTTITLPAPPTSEQVFDIAVYVNSDSPAEEYAAAEMKFVASTPGIALRGAIGSVTLSGQGTRYNDAVFDAGIEDVSLAHDPNVMAATPVYPGPSGAYGSAVHCDPGTVAALSGRNLLGFVSVRILPSIGVGTHVLRTAPIYAAERGPSIITPQFDTLYVLPSSISFEVRPLGALPEPAAGLLLIAALPLLRRRSR